MIKITNTVSVQGDGRSLRIFDKNNQNKFVDLEVESDTGIRVRLISHGSSKSVFLREQQIRMVIKFLIDSIKLKEV